MSSKDVVVSLAFVGTCIALLLIYKQACDEMNNSAKDSLAVFLADVEGKAAEKSAEKAAGKGEDST